VAGIVEIPHDVLGAVVHVESVLAEDEHCEEVGSRRPSWAMISGGDAIDRLSPAPVAFGLVCGVDDGRHEVGIGCARLVVDEHKPFAI